MSSASSPLVDTADDGLLPIQRPIDRPEQFAQLRNRHVALNRQVKEHSVMLDAIKAFLLDPDVRRAALDGERQRAAAERERITVDLATIDQRLGQIERQLGKLLDDTLADAFPAEQLADRTRDLMAARATELANREHRLAELAAPESDDIEAVIETLAPVVEEAFAVASPDELRRLLDLLRVDVHVIDRDHVRLTGLLQQIVTLSSR